MSLHYLVHLAALSGGILWIMFGIFFLAILVVVERMWYLHRVARAGHGILASVAEMTGYDTKGIRQLMESNQRYPQAAMLEAASEPDPGSSPELLAETLDEQINVVLPRIDRGLWILDTLITMAPMLGLLGTIVGIFQAFKVLGQPGVAPTAVTGGVAEALVTTGCGLFIAIVAMIFFNGMNHRARNVIHVMDTIKGMLVNRYKLRAHQRRAAAQS